jgi:predicted DNA-binding transcriptional regulator
MVSKDQAIGWVIFLICAVIAIVYFIALILPWNIINLFNLDMATETLRLYLVAIPVLIAFIAILGIGAWIGWTMATTPPPRPIEEIEAEETLEEEKEEKGKKETKEKKEK